jgi:DNA-binding transcriptional ArsR family regulator
MQSLDATFFALSDATRRAILARLTHGEATVMELAQPFEMTQPAVSRHLKVLEGAGLIARRVDGARRPCRIEKAGMKAVEQWLDMMRTVLARNYDRLDDVLAAMDHPKKGRKP